jgi:hypothetical protein
VAARLRAESYFSPADVRNCETEMYRVADPRTATEKTYLGVAGSGALRATVGSCTVAAEVTKISPAAEERR